MEVSETEGNEKKVGHCIINWQIQNYCLATCAKDWVIYSPEFCVRGPHTTKWRLILNSNSKINDIFSLTLTLHRLESDPGPNTVCANWKICFLNSKENIICVRNCKCNFYKNSTFGLDLGNDSITITKFLPFDRDTLNIRCQIIVYHCESTKLIYKSSDIELRSLSQDLKVLYRNSKFYDVVFKVRDEKIKAHKVILYTRNSNMAKLLDEEPNKKEINLSEVDFEALKNVIAYLYSGNLEFVIAKPSISLYECVTYLNIDELRCYYAPDEQQAYTTVDSREFSFLWLINDFSSRDEDCVLGPVFDKEITDTSWKFRFYPNGIDHNMKHVAISAQIIEGKTPLWVCLEIGIMDKKHEIFFLKNFLAIVDENEILMCNDFAEREHLEESSLSADDTLRIVMKLRTSSGEHQTFLGSRLMSFVSYKTKEKSYDVLFRDMACLYETGKFKDIFLFAGEGSFNVHKCILSARSKVLSSMINELSNDKMDLTILDIKPNILEIVIKYMYCGSLKDLNSRDIPQIYDAAETLAMSSLKDACSRILRKNLRVHSTCDTLTFADSRNDKELKSSVFNFISLNAEAIYEQPAWITLTHTKPLLCSEVIQFVTNSKPALLQQSMEC